MSEGVGREHEVPRGVIGIERRVGGGATGEGAVLGDLVGVTTGTEQATREVVVRGDCWRRPAIGCGSCGGDDSTERVIRCRRDVTQWVGGANDLVGLVVGEVVLVPGSGVDPGGPHRQHVAEGVVAKERNIKAVERARSGAGSSANGLNTHEGKGVAQGRRRRRRNRGVVHEGRLSWSVTLNLGGEGETHVTIQRHVRSR